MAFILDSLPYAYDALEPYIDADTMKLHHDKHHATYVSKLNAALEQEPGLGNRSLEELLSDLEGIPQAVRSAIRNHGGGHHNHQLFWSNLSPNGGGQPQKTLAEAIQRDFESFENFKQHFSNAAATLFGSGWQYLVATTDKKLRLLSLPNQDSPLSQGLVPLLGLDVWEHAYYLKYQNRRPEYIDAFWNLVNWKQVEESFDRI